MPLPAYEYTFKKYWRLQAADQNPNQPDPPPDPNTADPNQMQTLKTPTAQLLCERLWKGFISNDMSQFAAFFQQVDQVATNFLQSMPIPPDPATLEDADFSSDPNDLPSIGPIDQSD